MFDAQAAHDEIIQLLEVTGARYKLFHHRAALSYDDLAIVQQETGFVGTEGKCLVLKTDQTFAIYITIQGKKAPLDILKSALGVQKIRLATGEELKDYFGAEPGCAYPFGFSAEYPICIDPIIFEQTWFLFSPVHPTETVQVAGADLRAIYDRLSNRVINLPSTHDINSRSNP